MNTHRPRDAQPLAERDLHDYQRFCVEFIEAHPQCGVFLDMGLGKTAIALTAVSHLLYDSFEVSRVLIIAPLRVARDTWIAELGKWEQLHGLRLERVLGTPRERIAALSRKADLYVINRENVEWLVRHYAGRKLPFDMLVIDELSSFKNSRAKRFLALKKVLPQFTRVVGKFAVRRGEERAVQTLVDGDKLSRLRLTFGNKEMVKTGLGTLPGWKVTPTVLNDKGQTTGGRALTFWLSDDASRKPLRFEAALPIGAVTLTLTK